MATVLAKHDPAYTDLMTTFLEHAVRIAAAMNRAGLWDEVDGFFYDTLRLPDGSSVPLKIHSMVGPAADPAGASCCPGGRPSSVPRWASTSRASSPTPA